LYTYITWFLFINYLLIANLREKTKKKKVYGEEVKMVIDNYNYNHEKLKAERFFGSQYAYNLRNKSDNFGIKLLEDR
ncbi:uncharacterized protein LOC117792541, partial [Drosophila innubila]|uniref:uncharacterized protein LOC117792541 n=1 Tax=Drosophila innubila TaxID=198719 RepID=UPI00148CAB76